MRRDEVVEVVKCIEPLYFFGVTITRAAHTSSTSTNVRGMSEQLMSSYLLSILCPKGQVPL